MENEFLLMNILMELEEFEDEEINVIRARAQRLGRQDPFEDLSDFLFKKIFRLTKPVARILIDMLDPFLIVQTRRTALDSQTKVLVALHFYATGSYQLDIGYNVFSGVSQPSVSRCLAEVTDALNMPEIFNFWIRFPNNIEELNAVRRGFFENFQFPGVVGVIDGTHVAIVPPNSDDPEHPEHIYVNRKGYHSINTQLICDSKMKILNINTRFPGSTNDIYIWDHSAIQEVMVNISRRNPNEYYLLGDSGYVLRPWLQIPFANPEPGSPEERYNNTFKVTRSLIERCIGVLKMRFRCLLKHRVLHYHPTKCSKIINACAVLHNLCIHHNIPEPDENEGEDHPDLSIFNQNGPMEDAINQRQNRDLIAGRHLQQQIVRNYFT